MSKDLVPQMSTIELTHIVFESNSDKGLDLSPKVYKRLCRYKVDFVLNHATTARSVTRRQLVPSEKAGTAPPVSLVTNIQSPTGVAEGNVVTV